jgi:hypothetical protein
MKKTTKRILFRTSLIFAIIAGSGMLWVFSKEEVNRFKSPDGRHDCVITRYRYESLMPRMPGQGSDYSCFLSIYEGDIHCATIPVPIAGMLSDLRWEESEAYITAVGEWDFLSNTCFYWSEDQTTQISGLK